MLICQSIPAILLLAPVLGLLSRFDIPGHPYGQHALYSELKAPKTYNDNGPQEAPINPDPGRHAHQLRAHSEDVPSYQFGNRISARALTSFRSEPRPQARLTPDSSGIPVYADALRNGNMARSHTKRTTSTRNGRSGVRLNVAGSRNGGPRSRSGNSRSRRPQPSSSRGGNGGIPRTDSTNTVRGARAASGSSDDLERVSPGPTRLSSAALVHNHSPPMSVVPEVEEAAEHSSASTFTRTLTTPGELTKIASAADRDMMHSSNSEVKAVGLGLEAAAGGVAVLGEVFDRVVHGTAGGATKKAEGHVERKGEEGVSRFMEDLHLGRHHHGDPHSEGASGSREASGAPGRGGPGSGVGRGAPGRGPSSGLGRGAPGRGPSSGLGRGAPGRGPPSGLGRGAPGRGPLSGLGRGAPGREPPSRPGSGLGRGSPGRGPPSEPERGGPTGNRPEDHESPAESPAPDSDRSGSVDHKSDEEDTDIDAHQDPATAFGQVRYSGLRPRPNRPVSGAGAAGADGRLPPQSVVGAATRYGKNARPKRPPKPKKVPKKYKSTKPWNSVSLGLTTVGVVVAGGAAVAGTIAQEKGAEAAVKGADAAQLSAQAGMKGAIAAQLSAEAGIESAHANTIIAEANVKSSNASKEGADGTALIAAVNYQTAAHKGVNVTAAKQMALQAARTNSKRKRSYPPVMLYYNW